MSRREDVMPYSENIRKLKPSATMAMNALAKKLADEGRDILNLSAGEPDFDTPAFVSDAAVEGIRGGATRYTPAAGMPRLRKAIAARLSERAGRELSWEGVVITAGAKQALFNSIFSLFGPGDQVIVLAPFWTTYPDLVTLARAEPVVVLGDEERDFKVSPDVLDPLVTQRTRGIIINSPNNPTGAVYDLDEMTAIAGWAREKDLWLISDEIYRRIYHGDDASTAPGVLELPSASIGDYVLIDGLSKSHAMTGWRLGFSYSDPALARQLTALQSQTTSSPSTPTQMGACEAFENAEASDTSIEEMGSAFARRRELVTRRIRELLPGVRFVEPGGAFYLFFKVDGFLDDDVRDDTAWCARLLEREGVALVPGAAFGAEGWARMSYAAADDVLEDAVRRISSMVSAGAAL